MKFAAFDLEIAKDIPEGETDWKQHRPLGITCAAVATNDSVATFHDAEHNPMNRPGLDNLVGYLENLVYVGYEIVTWNGLSFDFDILAEESDQGEICKVLAEDHIDLMFQFFCIQGYFLGLDKAAQGTLGVGKPEGMDGSQAPKLWQQGEYDKVLSYLKNDVRITLGLANQVAEGGEIAWTSNRGNPMTCSMGYPLTVRECLELPLPDTSWMTDPYPRSRFTEWMR